MYKKDTALEIQFAPERLNDAAGAQAPASEFKQWICLICGWIYDEAAGLPEDGIAPGTRWEAIPENWRCPLCDVGKSDFVLVQI